MRGMTRGAVAERAVAIMRMAGAEPLDPYRGRKRPWRCRCLRCDGEMSVTLDSVILGRHPCKVCRLKDGDRSHPLRQLSTAAVAVVRAAGLEPVEPYPGASSPWRCRCLSCNEEAAIVLADVRRGIGTCPGCVRDG